MKRALSIACALAACLGCEDDPLGRGCEDGSACGALACLDGRCAPALEDPGGDAAPEGGPVRVIALGLHPTLSDVETQLRGTLDAGEVSAREGARGRRPRALGVFEGLGPPRREAGAREPSEQHAVARSEDRGAFQDTAL